MNGPMMAWFSGLNQKADEAGFIAVYPDGTGKNSSFFWNGGNSYGSTIPNNVDDVAFINALLDDLARAYAVDARRIYTIGLSNGAIMASRLAAEVSDRIAAVVLVAGAVGTEIIQPKRPVPVLHFHGTLDEYVPFTGGRGKRSISGRNFRSVEDSIRMWIKANGCDESPRIEVLAEGGDGLQVTRITYGNGTDGTEVVLVVIAGGGHTWPGRKSPLRFLGKSTLNISANDLMWEFFIKHKMK
jgi:polyhydroxybutyrate depolymerase